MIEQLKTQVETTGTHAAVAYHGLRAAIIERRINRNEAVADRLDHEAAYFQALGQVATQVVVSEAAQSPNTPTKPIAGKASHSLSGQARYHRMSDTYRKYGVANYKDALAFNVDPVSGRAIQIPDHDLPIAERRKRTSGTSKISIMDFVDPRDPREIIAPESRKELAAEKSVAKKVRSIRERRGAQAKTRSALGHTGPNLYWRTKLTTAKANSQDRKAFKMGNISAFELEERIRSRAGDMQQGEWATIRVKATELERDGKQLTSTLDKTAERASKKHSKTEKRTAKLEDKLNKRVEKIDEARARL